MSIDLSSIKNTSVSAPPVGQVEVPEDSLADINSLDLPSELNELSLGPPVPPKSPETIAMETEQRIILQLYQSKFPSELSILANELSYQNLNMLDLAALEALRGKCDKILGGSSAIDNKKKMFNSLLYVIEKISVYSGIECSGLTSTLLADKDYQRDVTRLALKYLSTSEMNPEALVPMKVLTTAIQLHANAELKRETAMITQKITSPANHETNSNRNEKHGNETSADNVAQLNNNYKDL